MTSSTDEKRIAFWRDSERYQRGIDSTSSSEEELETYIGEVDRQEAKRAAMSFIDIKQTGFTFKVKDLYEFCKCDRTDAKNSARWVLVGARLKGLIEKSGERATYIIL